MLPDRVSNPGPLTCESGAVPKVNNTLGMTSTKPDRVASPKGTPLSGEATSPFVFFLSFQNGDQLLKERICPLRNKFCPLRIRSHFGRASSSSEPRKSHKSYYPLEIMTVCLKEESKSQNLRPVLIQGNTAHQRSCMYL